MQHSQLSPLEVTQALFENAVEAGFEFGGDTVLVAVQHMLEQTVDLFETIADIGLSRNNIFALGKLYSNSRPVIDTLRKRGITVIENTLPEPGQYDEYFEADVKRLWQVVTQALAKRRIKRVLILDDGGFCITNVPAELLQRYSMCGIEQTSLGMFRFDEKPPLFAVMAWARAAVKLEIGGPIFSQCLIEKLQTEFFDRTVLRWGQLGVIGMGSIGRAMASLTAHEGKRVLYYDPRQDIRIHPRLRRHLIRVGSLEELMMRCDAVIGCSGRNPFRNNWPLNHKPNIKLLSSSGGDQEFGPIINYLKAKPDFQVDEDTWDISSDLGPRGPIQIAYLGYPYNFVSRAPEAVPTRIVQLETGGLLAALIQARMYLQFCEAGLARNRGIHRVTPKAQHFVYKEWRRAMRNLKIDIVKLFDYDSGMLSATHHDEWFAEYSEPRPGRDYAPLKILEEGMDQFAGFECNLKTSRRAAG